MSQTRHLRRAVKILRENLEDQILDDLDTEGQFTWNLKNWTIQFYKESDYESIVAYACKNQTTDWSDYITLEARKCEWIDLLTEELTTPKFQPAEEYYESSR